VSGRTNYRSCRVCHRLADEVGPISARGKCSDCGDRLQLENVETMRSHGGPTFRRWRERTAASVGGRLIDEPPGAE